MGESATRQKYFETTKNSHRERIKLDPVYRLVSLAKMLDVEMDGVSVPATAAAILNGIRASLNELED
jgi:hypothetical protein